MHYRASEAPGPRSGWFGIGKDEAGKRQRIRGRGSDILDDDFGGFEPKWMSIVLGERVPTEVHLLVC